MACVADPAAHGAQKPEHEAREIGERFAKRPLATIARLTTSRAIDPAGNRSARGRLAEPD